MPATAEPLPTTHQGLLEERERNRVAAQALHDAACAESRSLNTEERATFDRHIARAEECFRALLPAQNLAAMEAENRAFDTRNLSIVPTFGSDGATGTAYTTPEQVRAEATRQRGFDYFLRMRSKFRPTEEAVRSLRESGAEVSSELVGPRLSTQQFRGMRSLLRRRPVDVEELLQQFSELRALSSINGEAGGALVPPTTFIRRLEAAMLFYGGMYLTSDVIRTGTGEPISWPTFNDTANMGRRIEESETVAEKNPAFGVVKWYAHKYTSDELLVPYELLEDGAIDVASIIADALGERIGRILNRECTIGTGNNMPMGIVPAAPVGYTAATATGLTPEDMIRFDRSIDPAYRNGMSFMMHDNVLMALWLLKDSTGQPIFQTSYREGQPDRVLGRPLFINSDMAGTLEANADVIVAGRLSSYKIREVNDIRFYRLVERHREKDQDAFLAFVRRDGNLLQAGVPTVKKLRMAAS